MSGGHSSPYDAEEKRTQMAQTLHKSITIVFWYKPNTPPVRLHHSIPTFPLFQLADFPQLVADLGLSPQSYIDTYIPPNAPGPSDPSVHWEQHLITTVRAVVSDQRLLYKLRTSLIQPIDDSQCPGLDDEIARQRATFVFPPPESGASAGTSELSSGSRKRPLSPVRSSGERPVKQPATDFQQYLSTAYNYAIPRKPVDATAQDETVDAMPSTSLSPGEYRFQLSSPGNPADSTAPNVSGPPYIVGRTRIPARTASAHGQYANPSVVPSVPYHTHPPLKRWPNDYTVSEIDNGLDRIDALMAGTPSTPENPNGAPGITQRAAFEQIFGVRYVKSTLTRHRAVWRRADQALKDSYVGRTDENAYWQEFVKRVDGRTGRQAEWTARRESLIVKDVLEDGGALAYATVNGELQVPDHEQEAMDDPNRLQSLSPRSLNAADSGTAYQATSASFSLDDQDGIRRSYLVSSSSLAGGLGERVPAHSTGS